MASLGARSVMMANVESENLNYSNILRLSTMCPSQALEAMHLSHLGEAGATPCPVFAVMKTCHASDDQYLSMSDQQVWRMPTRSNSSFAHRHSTQISWGSYEMLST